MSNDSGGVPSALVVVRCRVVGVASPRLCPPPRGSYQGQDTPKVLAWVRWTRPTGIVVVSLPMGGAAAESPPLVLRTPWPQRTFGLLPEEEAERAERAERTERRDTASDRHAASVLTGAVGI